MKLPKKKKGTAKDPQSLAALKKAYHRAFEEARQTVKANWEGARRTDPTEAMRRAEKVAASVLPPPSAPATC